MSDDAWRYDELGWYEPFPVSPRDTNALGIDVSSYQGSPNWSQVAASGRQFVYIKASEGSGSSYPTLDAQYQGAKAAGIARGLYHFADPSQTPEANADAFSAQVNRLGAVPGHLPPCLDLETGTGALSGWAQRFITRLRADTSCVRVMVYSSASFFKNQIGESWMDPNIALWIANFGAPPGRPSYLTSRVAIHQYADNGQVSGIAGNVDLDYAIWPLSTIIPGTQGSTPVSTAPPGNSQASVLTAAEEAALVATYQQLSGSPTVGLWPGWPSWPGGSGRSLTLVDYARNCDVLLNQLLNSVAALKSQAETAAPVQSLSETDVQRVAAAVANMLAQRMQS